MVVPDEHHRGHASIVEYHLGLSAHLGQGLVDPLVYHLSVDAYLRAEPDEVVLELQLGKGLELGLADPAL